MKYPIGAHAAEGGRASWKATAWERDRRRQLVRQLSQAGMSAVKIAVRLGVTSRTVERDRRET